MDMVDFGCTAPHTFGEHLGHFLFECVHFCPTVLNYIIIHYHICFFRNTVARYCIVLHVDLQNFLNWQCVWRSWYCLYTVVMFCIALYDLNIFFLLSIGTCSRLLLIWGFQSPPANCVGHLPPLRQGDNSWFFYGCLTSIPRT